MLHLAHHLLESTEKAESEASGGHQNFLALQLIVPRRRDRQSAQMHHSTGNVSAFEKENGQQQRCFITVYHMFNLCQSQGQSVFETLPLLDTSLTIHAHVEAAATLCVRQISGSLGCATLWPSVAPEGICAQEEE